MPFILSQTGGGLHSDLEFQKENGTRRLFSFLFPILAHSVELSAQRVPLLVNPWNNINRSVCPISVPLFRFSLSLFHVPCSQLSQNVPRSWNNARANYPSSRGFGTLDGTVLGTRTVWNMCGTIERNNDDDVDDHYQRIIIFPRIKFNASEIGSAFTFPDYWLDFSPWRASGSIYGK